jgi:hypothetical protein
VTVAQLWIVAVLTGMGVGFALQRAPVPLLLQTTGAAFVTWVAVSIGVVAMWFRRSVDTPASPQ